jgi:hypothetical protein
MGKRKRSTASAKAPMKVLCEDRCNGSGPKRACFPCLSEITVHIASIRGKALSVSSPSYPKVSFGALDQFPSTNGFYSSQDKYSFVWFPSSAWIWSLNSSESVLFEIKTLAPHSIAFFLDCGVSRAEKMITGVLAV